MNRRRWVPLFALCLGACSGARSAGPLPVAQLNATRAQPAKAADPCHPHGGVLGGVCQTTKFTLPFGTWHVGAEGFVVYATESIVIDGDIVFDPGSPLGLYSPSITLNNRIDGNGATERTAKTPQAVTDVIDGCTVNDPNQEVTIPGGDSLAVVAFSQADCDIELGGVYVHQGSTGSSKPLLKNGLPGGSIFVGTSKAIDAARRLASQSNFGTKIKAFAPDVVGTNHSRWFAGNGGDGVSNCDPRFDSAENAWNILLGSGARGGNAEFYVILDIKNLELYGGTGGSGGTWCQPVVDGSAGDANALGQIIVEGSGGQGGDALANRGDSTNNGGGGGIASVPQEVSGVINDGTGWSSATEAGNGANIDLTLASNGKGGRGGHGGGPDGKYEQLYIEGGSGGTASGTGSLNGGTAGTVSINVFDAPTVAFPAGYIQVEAFYGGSGQNNCGAYPGLGGNGADAGTIELDGHVDAAILKVAEYSFTGGSAGSGSTVGTIGGPGTLDVNGTKSSLGSAGAAGTTC
ncbi:MAG: hypothetical protein JO029_04110 [Candidatus Eremiobacteraeota bacterium]|nr:hypothetical protein [Candidatus Eremiobacteraeota bacterium]